MHIAKFWIESKNLPIDVSIERIEHLVLRSLEFLPIELTQCDVVERDILYNGQLMTERICLVSIIYPELREIEKVFSDITHLDETGFNFSRGGTEGISALIPEIHPTLACRVHKLWGRVNGYEEHRPPDRTSVSISLYGEIPSEKARFALNKIATHVFEPREVESGKYETERSFGKSSGHSPEIEVYKVWPRFDMHMAEAFAHRVREIDREYHITNLRLLSEEFEKEWIETRYPAATIEGYLWRDTKDGLYWLHFQIDYRVHYGFLTRGPSGVSSTV
jgi:hypothetical protein